MAIKKRIAKRDLRVVPSGDSAAFRLEGGGAWFVGKANRFLRALGLRGLSTHTLRAYAYDLVILGRWLRAEGLHMKGLTQTTLIEFIAYQRAGEASAHSINRRLITIGSFYLFCYDRDLPSARGTSTPARHYIGKKHDATLGLIPIRRGGRRKLRVRAPRKLVVPLEIYEVNRFLEHIVRYRDLAITLLMLFSGLRSCEVLALRLADLRLGERAILVRGKGNKQRTVPVGPQLVDAIERYRRLERPDDSKADRLFVVLQGARRGQPMTSAGLRSIFRYRRRTFAVAAANPHRFRHTFGADMARSGVSLPVLQRMMGHANGLVTLQYINLSVEDISAEYHEAVKRVEARYGSSAR